MKWLTDDEFFGTEVATGVNLVESGDSLRDSFARAYFEHDKCGGEASRRHRAEFPQQFGDKSRFSGQDADSIRIHLLALNDFYSKHTDVGIGYTSVTRGNQTSIWLF
ncbi:MAG: hypothetical protein EAZ18_15950 [Oscillatoriales cyanobacterium]|nr:MAG: hypothetical protein EAZ18_15950 [Oscillatoriales cyanobacterium]